jgi:hypothetical protein
MVVGHVLHHDLGGRGGVEVDGDCFEHVSSEGKD